MSPISERDYWKEPEPDRDECDEGVARAAVPAWRRRWRLYLFVALVLVPGSIGGMAWVITAMLLVITALAVGIGVLWFIRFLLS